MIISQNKLSLKNDIIKRYGNAAQFAITFNPDLQIKCAQNIERTFTGNAPTIGALKTAYSENQVRVWVLAQLENLNSFSGAKNKMNPQQMMMLSDIILTDYFYLKASELLLFFHQFKSGKYGELYGSVDPLRVSNALLEFAEYRREELFRIESAIERERRRVEEEQRFANALTYEEWQAKTGKQIRHG